jgi:hypothetical protein
LFIVWTAALTVGGLWTASLLVRRSSLREWLAVTALWAVVVIVALRIQKLWIAMS